METVRSEKVTATRLVVSGPGSIAGIIVASHTNGTIKIANSTTAVGDILLETVTFAAGPGFYAFPKPIRFDTGLHVTVGGTLVAHLLIN